MLVPIERSFAVSVEPLSEPGTDNSQALILMHELTAMKRTEQMRADFVANASHELLFRSPRWSALSKRCVARPRTIQKHMNASWRLCTSKACACRGW